jgi:hypothetical protein
MADEATDSSSSKPKSNLMSHRRTASAAPDLGSILRSTDFQTPSLPVNARHYDPPKSASALTSREQPPTNYVQNRKEEWEFRCKNAKDLPSRLSLEKPLRKIGDTVDPGGSTKSVESANFHYTPPDPPSLQRLEGDHVVSTSAVPAVSVDKSIEHEPAVSPGSAILSTRPPSSHLSKHISAFEYAMRPFLKLGVINNEQNSVQSSSPARRGSRSDTDSTFYLPVVYDGSSRHESKQKSNIVEFGRPTGPTNRAAFETRMKHIQLRTFLMQCTMVQNTLRELERKPWIVEKTYTTRVHHEKMRSLAYKALQLSQALDNRDLQARCEYWAGRGCGGTRDYQAAEAHFEEAIRLNESNDRDSSGALSEGLRPAEKEDVHFLLGSCRARHQDSEERNEKIIKLAKQESIETQKSLQTCLDETPLISPPWMPDHDRIIELARSHFECVEPPSKISEPFVNVNHGKQLQAEVEAKMKEDERDLESSNRRTLSKIEWEYIKHGTATQLKKWQCVDEVATAPISQQPLQSGRSPTALSTSKHVVGEEAGTLPNLSPKSPPTDNLQWRRKVSLTIDTKSIRTQRHVGDATHAVSFISRPNDQDAESANPTNSKSTKPPPLLASSPPLKRNPSSSFLSPVAESELGYECPLEFPNREDNHDEDNNKELVDKQPMSARINKPASLLPQGEPSQIKQNHRLSPSGTPLLRTKSDSSLMIENEEGVAKIFLRSPSLSLKSGVSCASSASSVSMN